MASKNQQFPIPAPTQGLRKDLRPLAVPLAALVAGVNVVNVEGSLRPRPASVRREVSTRQWTPVVELADFAALQVRRSPRGLWYAVGYTRSTDEGVLAISVNGRQWVVYDLVGYGRIMDVAFGATTAHPIFVTDDGYVGRATTEDYPLSGSVAWSTQITHDFGGGEVVPVEFLRVAIDPPGERVITFGSVVQPSAPDTTAHQVWACDLVTAPAPAWYCAFLDVGQHPEEAGGGVEFSGVAYGDGYWFLFRTIGDLHRAVPQDNLASGDWSEINWGQDLVENLVFITDIVTGTSGSLAAHVSGNVIELLGRRSAIYVSTTGGLTWIPKWTGNCMVSGPPPEFGCGHLVGIAVRGNFNEMLAVGVDAVTGGIRNHLALLSQDDGDTWSEFPVAGLPESMWGISLCKQHGLAGSPEGQWLLWDNSVGTVCSIYIRGALPFRPLSVIQHDYERFGGIVVVSTPGEWLAFNVNENEVRTLTPTDNTLTGSDHSPTIFRTFPQEGKTYLLGTNGVDLPKAWSPDMDTYRDFEGSAPKARAMAICAGRVLLAGIPGYSDHIVSVSSINTFDAGWGVVQESILQETPGAIVALSETTGLQVEVWKEDALHFGIAQVEFGGVAAPFRFELIETGIVGPASDRAIVSVPGAGKAYMGHDGGVYVFDGSRVETLGRYVQAVVGANFDRHHKTQCHGYFDTTTKLLWFFYPAEPVGALNKGIVFDTGSGWPWPLAEVEYPSDWDVTAGLYGTLVEEQTIGDLAGQPIGSLTQALKDFKTETHGGLIFTRQGGVYWQDMDAADYTDDGTSIPVQWRYGWHALGGPLRFKTVHEIQHAFDELQVDESFSVTLHTTGRQVTEQSLKGPVALNSTTPYQKTSFRLTGRMFSMEIAADIAKRFSWAGGVMTFRTRGLR